jgi:hypothetical protein
VGREGEPTLNQGEIPMARILSVGAWMEESEILFHHHYDITDKKDLEKVIFPLYLWMRKKFYNDQIPSREYTLEEYRNSSRLGAENATAQSPAFLREKTSQEMTRYDLNEAQQAFEDKDAQRLMEMIDGWDEHLMGKMVLDVNETLDQFQEPDYKEWVGGHDPYDDEDDDDDEDEDE